MINRSHRFQAFAQAYVGITWLLLHHYPITIKIIRLGDFDLVELPDLQFLFGRNKDLVINLRRVVLRATDVLVAFETVDEHLLGLAHTLGIDFQRDVLLDVHQLVHSFLLHLIGNIIGHFVGGRALLG